MTRRRKDPLRPLTDQERHDLERLSRRRAPSGVVPSLIWTYDGHDY